MDWFARRELRLLVRGHGGYGRSTKTRDVFCDIANGADDLAAATDYIMRTRGVKKFSSTASRRARCAPPRSPSAIPNAWRGWRSTPTCGRRGQPDARAAAQELPEFTKTSAGRSTAPSCTRSSRATPDCADQRTVDAFADAILALDDSMPNGTYIDMCSKLPVNDPSRITVPTIVMRGQYDGIAGLPTTSLRSSRSSPSDNSSS